MSYLMTNLGIPALLLALWRNIVACIGLAAVLWILNKKYLILKLNTIKFYIVYGFILSIFNSIWSTSVQENGAAVATVLGYSSSGFTVIGAYFFFKETISAKKVLAVILSIVGCIMVSEAYSPAMWRLKPLGIAAGLLSGLAFAAYTLVGKEAARRGFDTWTSMLYCFGFGTCFLFIFNLASLLVSSGTPRTLVPQIPATGWALLVFLSLVPTILGYGLYTLSMNYLPASIASLIAALEPAFTAAQSYLLLGERMSAIQILGSLIIIASLVLVTTKDRRRN
jgi:drug/metabolite transporter (DMT)-like permease